MVYRGVLWPIVVSGRISGVQAELRSLRRDTSRMALFTSKWFAKTRACHDNFPHLKGNIHIYSRFIINNAERLYFPATDLYFPLMKRPRKIFRSVEILVVKIVLIYSD